MGVGDEMNAICKLDALAAKRYGVILMILLSAVIFVAGCSSPAKQDGIPAGQSTDQRAEADGRPGSYSYGGQVTVPKLALGLGSLALLRDGGYVLEVLDPAGRPLARMDLGDPSWPLERQWVTWSPRGDALLYVKPADAGNEAIGVFDFSNGEERVLWSPLDQETLIGAAAWVLPDRIFITLSSVWMGMYGPGLWWSLDPGGSHYGPFSLPRFASPLDDFTDYQVTAAAPDGKALLLTFFWKDGYGGIQRSAVARLDLTAASPFAAARMISPEGAERCDGGHFSRDGHRIFFTCEDGGAEAAVRDVYVAAADGSGARRRMRLPHRTWLFGDSPDGNVFILGGSTPTCIETTRLSLLDLQQDQINPLLDVGERCQDRLLPVGFTPDGRWFWVLRVSIQEQQGRADGGTAGDLLQVDLATGRAEKKAADVSGALVAR